MPDNPAEVGMEQNTLDIALARTSDPDTSHEAAAAVNANVLAMKTLGWLRLHGPATCDVVASGINEPRDSISPRMKPLEAAGLVRRDGKAPNQRGRSSVLWRATVTAEDRALAKLEATLSSAQRDVLDVIRSFAVAHDREVAQKSGRSETDARSRRAELVTMGLVVANGSGWSAR